MKKPSEIRIGAEVGGVATPAARAEALRDLLDRLGRSHEALVRDASERAVRAAREHGGRHGIH